MTTEASNHSIMILRMFPKHLPLPVFPRVLLQSHQFDVAIPLTRVYFDGIP